MSAGPTLDSLKNETKRLVAREGDLQAAQQARLEAIKSKQQKEIEEVKTQNEVDLLDLHDRSQAKLLETINAREDKLAKGRDLIEKTGQMLDKSRQNLADAKLAEIEELKFAQSDRYQTQYDKGQEAMRDINDRTSQSIQELNNEAADTLQSLTMQNKERVDTIAKVGEMRSQNKSQEFRRVGAYQDMEFSKILRQKDFEHQKEIGDLERKFLIDREGRTQSFAQQKQFKISEQEEALKQLDKSFKDKYSAMVEGHDQVMSNLKNRFEGELSGAIADLAKSRQEIDSKEADPFYSVTKLEPMLAEDEKSYIISIAVPEHERDLVNLAADDRQIKLSLARRFQERVESPDGKVDKTMRSEQHTKIFNVAQLVDQTKITQKYQDGLLSYKIMKA